MPGGSSVNASNATTAPEGPRPEEDDPVAAPPDTRVDRSATQRRITWPDPRTLILHGAVIGGLLAVSMLLWSRIWITGHPTSTLTCGCGDISEELWYVAWTPWAIAHGHNPLLSNAIFAGQGGVNMLANTTWMAFGALFAPVTWLFGPVATLNVGLILAPVVSGWCCFLALRKVTRFVPGQVAAAALYGLSPNVIGANGVMVAHLFMAWAFFPPLLFLCLYDLFVERRHRPALVGVALGALVALQFFTSTEVLALVGVMTAIALFAAVLVAPRAAWAHRREAAGGLGTAALVAGALLAYPVWFALAGPRHTVGPAWKGVQYLASTVGGVVDAGSAAHQGNGLLLLSGYFGPGGPDPDYLGAAVLLFILVSVVVWYRSRLAWVAAVTLGASWLLSLGPVVEPLRPATSGIWLPYRALLHVPVLSGIIPIRFSVVLDFAAALLLALSADGWWRLLTRAGPPRSRRRAVVTGGVLGIVLVLVMVPVATAYSAPFVIHPEPEPAWFRAVAPHLRAGTAVLTIPYASSDDPNAMGWLALSDMRFRLLGGYAIVPGRDGRHSSGISPLGGAEQDLRALSSPFDGSLPATDAATVGSVRDTLGRRGAQVVVVTKVGRDPSYAAGFLTAVLGRPPVVQRGAWVWYGLGSSPPLRLPPGAVQRCAGPPLPGAAVRVSQAVPACVMAAATGT